MRYLETKILGPVFHLSFSSKGKKLCHNALRSSKNIEKVLFLTSFYFADKVDVSEDGRYSANHGAMYTKYETRAGYSVCQTT